tara:strand:+ start:1382 stop:1762 length:381 start_codon:yes stop_codon:yes gene_type:complete
MLVLRARANIPRGPAGCRHAGPTFITSSETIVSLTTDDVRKVAHLARLGLDDAALEDYARDLSSILDVVDHLGQADTTDVAPMSHPLDLAARLRDDVPDAAIDREAFQSVAPDTAEGVYRVPKVIE